MLIRLITCTDQLCLFKSFLPSCKFVFLDFKYYWYAKKCYCLFKHFKIEKCKFEPFYQFRFKFFELFNFRGLLHQFQERFSVANTCLEVLLNYIFSQSHLIKLHLVVWKFKMLLTNHCGTPWLTIKVGKTFARHWRSLFSELIHRVSFIWAALASCLIKCLLG